MDLMYNISLERQKFYANHDFKNLDKSDDVEVIYTWKMDFNRSLLGAATLLVPKTPTQATGTISSTTMPLWAHNSWVCLFAAMLAIAIGGNAIVIWIVTAHRRMRTVTNYFLVNLSFADLMMASLNCLFNFIYMLHSDWVFGVRYCQLSNFIANVTVAASVFTLTGISFDRYQAIVRPMRPRMSKSCSLIIIAAIWVSGMLLAIPCLLYSTTKEYKSKGTMKTACLLLWPDGLPDVSYMDFMYQVLFFVITYAIPMLGMTFFYSAMGRVLWGSTSIGELTQRQADSIRSKRKVVKMFILVIVIFGICWLPYHTYFIYTHFNPSILYMKYVQHMYLGFYWLAMANAMVNPIIYYWMNAKFRTYFRTAILCRWRDVFRRRKRPLPESPPDFSQSGSRSRSDCDETRESEASDPIMSNVSTNVTQVPNSTVLDIAAQGDAEVTPNLEETSELDSDLLEILGIDPSNTEQFGKNIQKDVAIRFEHLATNGLSKDDRKQLTEKYLTPANCKLVSPPILNPEIKAALSETIVKRDKVIASKQALLSTAISGIGEAITHILASKEKQPELLRILMDTGRALCDCQHNDTISRRNFVVFSVKKEMKESLLNAKVDNYLFGQNLSETLKSVKAINKSGAELKVPTLPKPSSSKPNSSSSGSKNWKGSYPPRKQPAKVPKSSATMKNQRASSFKQSQNQRPIRTTTAPHSHR